MRGFLFVVTICDHLKDIGWSEYRPNGIYPRQNIKVTIHAEEKRPIGFALWKESVLMHL